MPDMANFIHHLIKAEKNRRAVDKTVFSNKDRHERTKLRARNYYKEIGYEGFKNIHMRALSLSGLVRISEIQKITGLNASIFTYLISRGAIERTRKIKYICYTVEQVACLMQAKIYSTVIRDDKSMLDMKLMCKFLKKHWPEWEARYDKYKFKNSKRQSPSSDWLRITGKSLENDFWTGLGGN
jgi:hypothetical protein